MQGIRDTCPRRRENVVRRRAGEEPWLDDGVGSPAARAMSRRAATQKRLQEGAKDTGSDEDLETDDDEGEEEAAASENERCDGVVRCGNAA